MGYYTGDYYRGDNYGGYAAGGLFKTIGKFLGGAAKTVIKASPVGQIAGALFPTTPFAAPPQIAGGPPLKPVPGFGGTVSRLLPGGESGYMVARRRRINPLNIKALRRAMRRAKGFEKQARRVGSFFNPGKSFRLKGRGRRKK